VWGACAVDLALPAPPHGGGGGDATTTASSSSPKSLLLSAATDARLDALARLRALHADHAFCEPWRARALGVLAAGGAVLRLVAAAVLACTWRAAWWSGG
jgi:hypothetical protein